MKTILFSLFFLFVSLLSSEAQDLPSPTANFQVLTKGSYVIPMDNFLQTNGTIGSGNFNLRTYGLIVHLLNNNVKVKWVIKAGKPKDGIDFSGIAEQLKPSLVTGGMSRNFRAGPFVIFSEDTTGVASLIDGFYSSQGLTGNNRPKIFRLTASVANVDIRYDLTGFKPKAVILTDGGNQAVHVAYMTASSIPVTNYTLGLGTDLLAKCFTFASEPHNELTGITVNTSISAIKAFVQHGGNFLAQCAAIVNYENNPLGRFQTVAGITKVNAVIGTSVTFPNPDLSFSQIHGDYDGDKNGSVRNWTMTAGTNNKHNHATGTGVNASIVAASVSKMVSGSGGLVFYIGNHEFANTSITGINGIRMYMNAFLTPVSLNNNCVLGEDLTYLLPVELLYFTAMLNNNGNKAELRWATSSEVNASHFVIEKSTDGHHFTGQDSVFVYGNKTAQSNYQFDDNLSATSAGILYYRLRMVDADGKFNYSAIRIIRVQQQAGSKMITVYPNPVDDELHVALPAHWLDKNVQFEIFNSNGQLTKKSSLGVKKSIETLRLAHLAPGIYLVRMTCNNEVGVQKIVKK